MTAEEVKKKISKFNWERWLERPFYAFQLSLFSKGQTKKCFQNIGIPDFAYPYSLFYNGAWYRSFEVHELTERKLAKYLKNHHVREITTSLEKYRYRKKIELSRIVSARKLSLSQKLLSFYEIMTPLISYIWITHALEHLFVKKMNTEVPKYVKGNTEDFIAKASFPRKKVATNLLEDALRAGVNPKEIVKRFGWIRVRDGFTRPFNLKEILEMNKHLKTPLRLPAVKIPGRLKSLFSNGRELVYLRTQRTDVYYELHFLARPILIQASKKYHIPFEDLKYYTIQSLITGKPKRYPKNFGWANYLDHSYFYPQGLISEKKLNKITEAKGVSGFPGLIRGKAKIILSALDLCKIKKGDVLIAPTTAPSFIVAMRLASAFVTDEGGITSHAAIVAREMGKPCVIGTKIATKVFKDGDRVEVDANKGIVRLVETKAR